jgi:enoyl-CoA hydratase
MPGSEQVVLIDEPSAGVRRLTLNRPGKRNALSTELRTALFAAMRDADRDTAAHVMLIRGAGSCWSAGYDLAEDATAATTRHAAMVDGWWARQVVDGWFEMWDYATPIVAQVHGYCLAGGTELAAACDLVYVADDAQIGYPPVRSMSPPDMAWQPWLMGMRRAMESLLTGDPVIGRDAVAAGFANKSFPPESLESEVLRVAERVAKVPGDLLTLSKRTVHRAMEVMGIRAGIRATTELQALGLHQRSSRASFAALADGLPQAFSDRDGPFGDYGASAT